MKEKYLLIDSRDRTAASASTCEAYFELSPAMNNCQKIELMSFSVPNTQNNVTQTNNTIYFNDGINRNVSIPVGNIDLPTLLTSIKSALESVSALTYTVTYTLSQKIQIVATGNFRFMFGTNTIGSAAAIMGFNNVDTVLSPFQLAPNVVNLSLPLYFYVCVDEFSTTTKSSNNFDNASFTILNNANGGDVVTFTETSFYPQEARVTDNNIQTLHVQLKNYNNQIMDLQGSNWCMLLRIYYLI